MGVGSLVQFNNGNTLGIPSTGAYNTNGTCIQFNGATPGSLNINDYSTGLATAEMWRNVPTASTYTWRFSGVSQMSLSKTTLTAPGMMSIQGATNIAYNNTGNYIETAASSGLAYIDFHNGLNTDNVDYNSRLISDNSGFSMLFDTPTKKLNVSTDVFSRGSQVPVVQFIFGSVTATASVGNALQTASIGSFVALGTRAVVKIIGFLQLRTGNPQINGGVYVAPMLVNSSSVNVPMTNAYNQFIQVSQNTSLPINYNFAAYGQMTGLTIGSTYSVQAYFLAYQDTSQTATYSFNCAKITHFAT
jgi:hypothetical protein